MAYNRPIVLSIAGLDPSGGAGLLADIKTFEQHRCLGFGAASAWTVQTEILFGSVHWLSLDEIIKQLSPLFETYSISAVKIGIIQNLDVLLEILRWMHLKRPSISIVWDPVLAPSAGGKFLADASFILLSEVLQLITIVTPNIPEAKAIAHNENAAAAATYLSRYAKVYLKGGHAEQDKGVDILYDQQREIKRFSSAGMLPPKHGSGCILSSAIAAGIALDLDIITACERAKTYTEKVLNSNPQLLAYHHV